MESLYSDYSLATKYHCQGEYTKAMNEWIRLATYMKHNANIFFMMGLDSAKLGYYDFAINCFDKAISIDPNHPSYPEARQDALKKMEVEGKDKKIIDLSSLSSGRTLSA